MLLLLFAQQTPAASASDIPGWVIGVGSGGGLVILANFILSVLGWKGLQKKEDFTQTETVRDKAWIEMEKVVEHTRSDYTRMVNEVGQLNAKVAQQDLKIAGQTEEITKVRTIVSKCEKREVGHLGRISHLESEVQRLAAKTGEKLAPYKSENHRPEFDSEVEEGAS